MFTLPFTFFSQEGTAVSFSLYIGGDFTTINSAGVYFNAMSFAKIGSTGADQISPDPGFTGVIKAIAVNSDGKITVGGSITDYKGTSIGYLVRMDSTGNIDTGFNTGTGFNGDVEVICQNDDGTILVGGNFTSYNGTTVGNLIKLLTDGSIDTSMNLGAGTDGPVYAIAKSSEGYYLFGGNFTNYNSTPFRSTAMFCAIDSTGQVPNSKYTGGNYNGAIRGILVSSAGKVVVVGDFTSYWGITTKGVGLLQSSYINDFSNYSTTYTSFVSVYSVAEISNGDMIVVGDFYDNLGGRVNFSTMRFSGASTLIDNLQTNMPYLNAPIRTVIADSTKNLIVMVGDFYPSSNPFAAQYKDRILTFDFTGNFSSDLELGVGGTSVRTVVIA